MEALGVLVIPAQCRDRAQIALIADLSQNMSYCGLAATEGVRVGGNWSAYSTLWGVRDRIRIVETLVAKRIISHQEYL